MSADAAEQAKQAYAEREKRLYDTIAMVETDRVPIIYYTMFWHATYGNISFRRSMYDYKIVSELTKKAVLELQPDAIAAPHMVNLVGPTMDMIGYKQLRWPGNGVDENHSYQYIDAEYMKPEEYDDIIEDPTYFYLTRFLPRIASIYEPFAALPQMSGFQHLRAIQATRFFAMPGLPEAFAKLAEAGREMQKAVGELMSFMGEMAALGFPGGQSATAPAPYDYFADYLRGSKGAMLDMMRRKDKLLQAMDHMVPILAKSAISVASRSPCKIVFMPMHWGLDGFMSLPQFKTFFWPQLRRVIMMIVDAGLVPLVLWEGDCTSRLETIADIPHGKVIYWFERTDVKRAKAVLGDHICIRGNVPASLLNTGTPDEVTAYCKDLIETVGKGGGFILDGGIGIPDEAKLENVRAMFAAVHRFSPPR